MILLAKSRLMASQEFLPKKLLMLDCEMTGLDPRADDVIQLACIKLTLVNGQYVPSEEFNEFVHTDKQPETEFAKTHMMEVYEQANASTMDYAGLRSKLETFLGDDVGLLSPCGDCVPTDVMFLYMKDVISLSKFNGDTPVAGTLHYEYFDANSIKLVARHKEGYKFDKELPLLPGAHDALIDCKNQTMELNAILKVLL